MTRAQDKPETARKVVVVFDISSSTTILEDLKRSDNLTVWRDFYINLNISPWKNRSHGNGNVQIHGGRMDTIV